MEVMAATVVAVLFAGGVYLILRRSLMRLILGLVLLGHGANLLLFSVGGFGMRRPPLVMAAEVATAMRQADPLPQALILTAIVISFGVLAFTIILVLRAWRVVGSDDVDQFVETDQ